MSVEDYINSAPQAAQVRLSKIRSLVAALCPDAIEVISYKMPAFKQGRVFIYYAAFKKHIGIYPPVSAPLTLVAKLEPYRGPKGNLQFSYDDDMPEALIAAVIKALHAQYAVMK